MTAAAGDRQNNADLPPILKRRYPHKVSSEDRSCPEVLFDILILNHYVKSSHKFSCGLAQLRN